MTANAERSTANRVFLFKIVTVKDEIIVGLDDAEIATLNGDGAAAVGAALAAREALTLMQYAVRKGADGELEQAPLHRVSILAHDSLRVEPYRTPLRIVPAG